ncbi:MAG: hypothetical protein JWO85_2642 [Candidatus Eremiobacteraeota bacterium]|nr:hypothetical protein [Candidatus Eremiobacteraeota bacterium]
MSEWWERDESRDAAYTAGEMLRELHAWLVENSPKVELDGQFCRPCNEVAFREQRMLVEREGVLFFLRCPADPSHPTRPLDRSRFARFIADRLGIAAPTAAESRR